MDFLHVVEQRRAVRRYRPAPIERPLIEWLINTAVLAPSAMNLQPWAFAVVTDVKRIDEYARRAKEHLITASAVPAQVRDMLNEPNFSMIVLQIVLGLLANMVVMWFSRQREFRADAGGAKLAGTGNMIGALERLDAQHGAALPGQMAAFGISGRFDGALRRLFMSHPPIAERIAALRASRYA